MGFIAPNGDWFPCGAGCHCEFADHLAAQYGLETYDSIRSLDKALWIRIISGGYVIFNQEAFLKTRAQGHPTPEQASTLQTIVELFDQAESDGVNFNESLRENPEDYYSQCCADPDHRNDFIKSLHTYLKFMLWDSSKLVPNETDVISKRRGSHSGD